ncbi:MAG TPA: hypothetical protein VGO58_13440 [Chitinophagaceae bacterium]|jgi:hypothetical protein|nr:hypothetical protein [Chitinophagaceae bacterium]
MNNRWKYVKIAAIGFAVLGLFYLTISFLFNNSRSTYTKDQAIANFNKKEKELYELVNYFRSIKPEEKEIMFGLGDNQQQFHIYIGPGNWLTDQNHRMKEGVNIKAHSAEGDSILRSIQWDDEKVHELQKRLKQTKCINIYSSDQSVIIDHKKGPLNGFAYHFRNNTTDSISWMPNIDVASQLRKDVQLLFVSAR